MLSKEDKAILQNLKTQYPEAYDLFLRKETEHQENIKYGCHDIRNIITLISGSFQLLELTNPELKTIPRWVQVSEDIDCLVSAINTIGLYRYADLVKLSPTSVSSLISSIHNYIVKICPDNSRQICINTKCRSNTVTTDEEKLSEAVSRLIDNAVEATDFLTNSTDTVISINLTDTIITEARYLKIEVSNLGPMPSADISNKMFKPFTTSKLNHLGLGLSIAAKTIDALNGELTWTYADGMCTFIATMPC